MDGIVRANAASILMHPHRLQALRLTGLLDVSPNVVLDRLSRLVTRLLRVPVATVTLIDENGQHFPGMAGLDGAPAENVAPPFRTHSASRYSTPTRLSLFTTLH